MIEVDERPLGPEPEPELVAADVSGEPADEESAEA